MITPRTHRLARDLRSAVRIAAVSPETSLAYEHYLSHLRFPTVDAAIQRFREIIEHENKQVHTQLFGRADPDAILETLRVVRMRGNKYGFRSIYHQKPKPKKYTYNTTPELAVRQELLYTSYYGPEFGSWFTPVKLISVGRIHGTESVDPARVAAIVAHIKDGGDLPPLLLEPDGGILDGHHRLEAAKRLKIRQVPAIIKMTTEDE